MKVEVACPCSVIFETTDVRVQDGRGKYCSKSCMYRFRVRPKGLTYQLQVVNKAWLKPGHTPWNANMKGIRLSPATEIKPGQRISPQTEFPRGEQHPCFKGDDAGYAALHAWVRSRRRLPDVCEKCNGSPGEPGVSKLEWANISQEYKRDLDDWMALCRKCHWDYDRDRRMISRRKVSTK